MEIGEKVKQYRKRLGLTQLKLANKIGVSESYICKIEKNKKMMTLKKLELLAKALKCNDVKDLL